MEKSVTLVPRPDIETVIYCLPPPRPTHAPPIKDYRKVILKNCSWHGEKCCILVTDTLVSRPDIETVIYCLPSTANTCTSN